MGEQQKVLAHTPDTLRKLELLAAACQSGRAVLLEGETCSGKTSLVAELARLAQRPLTVFHLNAETGSCGLLFSAFRSPVFILTGLRLMVLTAL